MSEFHLVQNVLNGSLKVDLSPTKLCNLAIPGEA